PSRVRYQTAPLPVASKRATGIEPVLGAWKAPVQPLTPRPRKLLNVIGAVTQVFSCAVVSGRRSSIGTCPDSSASPGGAHRPEQLSRAPSSVTVEPLKA